RIFRTCGWVEATALAMPVTLARQSTRSFSGSIGNAATSRLRPAMSRYNRARSTIPLPLRTRRKVWTPGKYFSKRLQSVRSHHSESSRSRWQPPGNCAPNDCTATSAPGNRVGRPITIQSLALPAFNMSILHRPKELNTVDGAAARVTGTRFVARDVLEKNSDSAGYRCSGPALFLRREVRPASRDRSQKRVAGVAAGRHRAGRVASVRLSRLAGNFHRRVPR